LEEALAAMAARCSDEAWDYAEPTPRDVPLDIEIEAVDGGYSLIYGAVDDSLLSNDTWHETQDDAEESAVVNFGVQAHEWHRRP
jgi:hypothetical protein